MSHRIRQWFDKLEKVLTAQAEFAGLLKHNATIGQLREFFTKKVLIRFLPSNLTVGSGQIISTNEKQISKQIDVIIYDSDFPKFSFTGDPDNSLYPVEGVLATIELKTELYGEELKKALDNCYSVATLDIDINPNHKKDLISQIMKERGVIKDIAEQILYWRIAPRTYIFAFRGYNTKEGLKNGVSDWYNDKLDYKGTFYNPRLPRVIVAGDVVGLARDEKIRMKDNDVFAAFEWTSKFGLLASHLLSFITDRLRPTDRSIGFSYTFHRYIPFKIYAEEIKKVEKIGFFLKTQTEYVRIRNYKKPPESIAKQVKREAGFGCCVCGCPIFGYHYLEQYKEDDKLFNPENLIILCFYHQLKCFDTRKPSISRQDLIEYKKNPFNIKNGDIGGLLLIETTDIMIKPFNEKSLKKGEDCIILEIESESVMLFSIGECDNLEITLDFYDKEGNLLAVMDRNNFISKYPILWEFDFSKQSIKISQKDRDIFFELHIKETFIELQANLWWKGFNIVIYNDEYRTLTI